MGGSVTNLLLQVATVAKDSTHDIFLNQSEEINTAAQDEHQRAHLKKYGERNALRGGEKGDTSSAF